ncbi:MAG TPA: alpha-amlyase, partial [Bacteroidales bacterium]|nr:alpha-amlyase [Bacteroidales bacterium]
TEKIKDGYFKQLGINTIWMSPVAKNPEGAFGKYPNPETAFSGYHGYWPISSTLIDDRMGTSDELKELIEVAHKNGINVLLDYVAHHVHQDHPAVKMHPDWYTNLYLPDSTLNVMIWDEQRLTTWFDVFLPTFNFQKPEVVEAMTDSAVYWFANYQLDGFRHDATKHVPNEYWRSLTYKLRSQIMQPQNR